MELTLKQMRRVKDVTLKEMADLFGVSYMTYSRWERNPSRMHTGTLLRVLNFLGFKMDDLKMDEGESDVMEFEDKGE